MLLPRTTSASRRSTLRNLSLMLPRHIKTGLRLPPVPSLPVWSTCRVTVALAAVMTLVDVAPQAESLSAAAAPFAATSALVGSLPAFVEDVAETSQPSIAMERSGVLSFGRTLQEPLGKAVVVEDHVNLRKGPGTSYGVVAQLGLGTQLQILQRQAGWAQVSTQRGTTGWVLDDYLGKGTSAVAPAPEGVAANVIEDGANLRAGPGTGYRSYGTLAADTQVVVLARQDEWYRVRSARGTIGWIATELIALDSAAAHLVGGTGKADTSSDVVRVAQRFLGAKYIWGGADPSGFDCSGFTMYVYRQVGVRLPRTANQQFSVKYGRRIGTIKALAPGDLVYFERTTTESGITHAGIYVGNGRIIAARSERLGVRYVSLYEPFWNTRFVGAIRPHR